MTVDNTPTIDQFRPIVLRVLSNGGEHAFKDVCQMTADHMGLSQEVRGERLASGKIRYVNRIGWACSALTQAGLLERPRRAHYRITDNGKVVDQRSLSEYSERDMLEWPVWVAYQEELAQRRRADETTPSVSPDNQDSTDPVESLTAGENAFNTQTETKLRKRLQESSPEFFERAVIDVLWAMGYGGAHGEKKHVGRTRDGGIDGIIRQDALGLTNIYIQAKRYADSNKVGEPEVRNFIGSLDARGANLGVFITTSSFQPAAEKTAAGYRHGKIVLIDGIKLTSLMLAYGVAVHKAHEFTLYEIDDDFFEEDELG
ncbi:restriction endonuclease [Corynebacterium sp. 319]|uniref:restriction endonuclease n=1 Tax=unclassified Corynebacterium TaxID=2624378 RepID=UPI00125CA88C|nr:MULTISPECIES: restriction endonuclease [unclassified Corynebacterium]KAB1554248.1 restriction endonuclease [Corynebacterium sp. 319]KAB3540008.1 restriction endonuclease [Corynebacterium sp. 366]